MEMLGTAADGDGEREFYLHELEAFADWPSLRADPLWPTVVEEDDAGFALFVACDATNIPLELLVGFAEYCVDNGVFWVSTFGADCERVHDLFDEVDVDRGLEGRGVVMTAWHNREPIDEALDLFWDAFPDEEKRGGPARIALAVSFEEWAEEVRRSATEEMTA
jgi:hypothetical protein